MLERLGDNLITVMVMFVLAVIMYVIVVGGILCIQDQGYNFSDYLDDLSRLQPILIAAVVGALGRAFVPLLRRPNGNGHGG
jgi:pilus assembly protein TadC